MIKESSKDKRYKVIVAHPGKQHSFQLAYGLKKCNLDVIYCTTVYNKPHSLTWFIIKMLRGNNKQKAILRRDDRLDDAQVIQFCELSALLLLFCSRFKKLKKLSSKLDLNIKNHFGVKVAKLAMKTQCDAVVMYDTNATKGFEYLSKKAPQIKRIMDVSAANRLYMKNIYEKDFTLSPSFSDKLFSERSFLWNENSLERLKKEIVLTNQFLVPSKFVKDSLTYSGVKQESVFICPYGANYSSINVPKKYYTDRPLQIVYVGNVTEMKGIYYLLEATQKIDKKKATFTIVGNYDKDDVHFSKYIDSVSFTGLILHSEVEKVLKNADLFVFPSLGDSFGLAVLEALSCGLPCIVSEYTGAKDIITDYENGFVVKAQSVDAIVEKIDWCVTHKDKLQKMSENAIEVAKQYSWDLYYRTLESLLSSGFIK